MTTLFSDGFESGDFTAWSAVNTTAGAGIAAQVGGGFAHAGSFGARMYKPTVADNGYARAIKSITPPGSGIVTFDLYMYPELIYMGPGSSRLQTLHRDTPVFNSIVWIELVSGVYRFYVRNINGTTQFAVLPAFSENTWYRVTMTYDGSVADPVAKAYVDGAEVASLTDVTTGTVYLPDYAVIQVLETSFHGAGDVYFDDIIITDAPPDFGGDPLIIPQIQLHRRQLWSG